MPLHRLRRLARGTGRLLIVMFGLHLVGGPVLHCLVAPAPAAEAHGHHGIPPDGEQDGVPHGDCCVAAACCAVIAILPPVGAGAVATAPIPLVGTLAPPPEPLAKSPRLLPPAVGPPLAG